jgi:hypothetical protein
MMRLSGILTAVFAILIAGCDPVNQVVERRVPEIDLTITTLPRLGAGEGHYQLWAKFVIFNKSGNADSPLHDSTAVRLGEFNVSEDGRYVVAPDGSPAHFIIPEGENPQLIDDLIITIQSEFPHHDSPRSDTEPGPALLGGRIYGTAELGEADLDASYEHALGSSFSRVSGSVSLMAPSSPSDSSSGVWFVNGQPPFFTPGLRNLPVLPEGWVYEGWARPFINSVIHDALQDVGPAYSTGRFLRADTSDFDGAGPGGGSAPGLSFPGQDFINAYAGGPPPRISLRDWQFQLTIEPAEDNSPLPFSLVLLTTWVEQIPHPLTHSVPMQNVSTGSFPRAHVTIRRTVH